ncbi:pyrroloquinoline quinone-dependent dehydrogenase [Povalibacter sp.]|uniref:pyrroloquinoline quinone-dependent dehydrogenase n=1 Tax=Povalibacter sp. TaxID=1962978 RepID=UPI002F400DE9
MSFRRSLAFFYLLAVPALAASPQRPADDDMQWGWYGGDAGGSRYANLRQIDRGNVGKLRVAWTYRTGELGAGFLRPGKLSFETTPILVNGSLYLSTPTNIVIALDPATGRERWRYDPKIPRDRHYSENTSRGVSWWIDTTREPAEPCASRIFMGTLDARLIAIDGTTGRPCADFGVGGSIDLSQGVRMTGRGDYLVSSPPALYGGLVITGSAIGDNRGVELERGVVRAFDARSGTQRWAWDPIPTATSTDLTDRGWTASGAQRTGAANAWSILSVDAGRDLVFVPTGSASPDFFGGERSGDNRYANSLVALRASTGKLVWHRQLIHHDLWDYDLAAQPLLIDIERDGKSIAAVIQATKTGMLFVFDRETGEPVFEIVERTVPASDVPGEATSPTQPFPATPALVSHAAITPQDAWGLTFYDRGRCRELIENYRSEGIFTPPSLRGSIFSPGYAGGVNWGSLAFDSERQLILAAVNNVPMVVTLIPRDRFDAQRKSGDWPQSEFARQEGAAYGMRREALMSPLGLPCTAPPWGTLAAIDLKRNAIRWQVMLGSTRDRTPWFVPSGTLGMPNMGGPIVTAGGLAFIGAATDNYLRAFDVETGQELWKGRLPAGGQATPMTYEIGGRQFVVIAAGGHGGLDTTRGDYVVAFALPQE